MPKFWIWLGSGLNKLNRHLWRWVLVERVDAILNFTGIKSGGTWGVNHGTRCKPMAPRCKPGRILHTLATNTMETWLSGTILQVTDDSQEFLRLKIWSMAGWVDWDGLAVTFKPHILPQMIGRPSIPPNHQKLLNFRLLLQQAGIFQFRTIAIRNQPRFLEFTYFNLFQSISICLTWWNQATTHSTQRSLKRGENRPGFRRRCRRPWCSARRCGARRWRRWRRWPWGNSRACAPWRGAALLMWVSCGCQPGWINMNQPQTAVKNWGSNWSIRWSLFGKYIIDFIDKA